jgi:hypothetical protein
MEQIQSFKIPPFLGGMGVATLLLGCVPACALALGSYGRLAALPCGLVGCCFLADCCYRGRSRSRYGGCYFEGLPLASLLAGTTNNLLGLEDFERIGCQVLKNAVTVGSFSNVGPNLLEFGCRRHHWGRRRLSSWDERV